MLTKLTYSNHISMLTKLNKECIDKLLENKVSPSDMAYLSIYDLHDDLNNIRTHLLSISRNVQTISIHMYVCPKCKKRDQSYEERQTRSLDEGVTVICTCNVCGYRWNP